MPRQILGSKGGSGGASFVTKPDTLRSNDSFEILLGLGSGRWKGLVEGLKGLKVNGVPLENTDGTSNFEDVAVIFADGNPLEEQIVNFKLGGGGATQAVSTQLSNPNASGPGPWVSGAVATQNADFIDLRFVIQQLFYQDDKSIRENTANIEIEMRPSNSSTWVNIFTAPQSSTVTYDQDGFDFLEPTWNARVYLSRSMFNVGGTGFKASVNPQLEVRGKTSSPYVKELRVKVPKEGDYANVGWEVRARLIEKDTVENDTIQERRIIAFESISAIIKEPLGDNSEWDGQVWMQVIGKASDQFNGFPELEGVFDTKICKTPPTTVWDPDTRVYTGTTWDGSYEEHFTTDPAWQIKEFVEDPIHGLAGLQPGSTLDKWDALEASKYYSEQVPDGRGGTHARFNLNLTINEAQDVNDLMQYLAGAVNSYTEDVGDGKWRLKVDKPETPKVVFTEDNIFGEFNYSHTDVDSRFNDWRGTFLNEDFDYEQDTVRVFDQPDIDENGTRFTEVALIGCTNRQEALRRLMFRVRVSLNEYKVVSFLTNRLGRYINPLDTILVADGALNADHLVKSTSRIESYADLNVTLKRPVRLEVGVNYIMHFTTNDKETVTRTVTNGAGARGDVTAITIDSALPANIMADSAIALEAVDLPANPISYRVISVERSEENEDEYAITASIIDSGKWNAMDNVSETEIQAQSSDVSIDSPTVPIDGMFEVLVYATEFDLKRALQVNWDRPGSLFLEGFKVEYRINDGPWKLLAENLSDSVIELEDPQDGTYDFKITALDRRGVQSNPLVGRYELVGSRELTAPTHLRGTLAARPATAPYEGFRYTVTDGVTPVTHVWEAGDWTPENNLVTEGSHIGVENGATVGMTPAEEATVALMQVDIDDLFTTYGDTASAAQSAADAESAYQLADAARIAAETAESDAQAAQLAAETAFNDAAAQAGLAADHKTAAETAKNDALTAATNSANSATAAAGSATTASSQADAASDSATAASGSATAAQTSASNASVSAGQAASSATNADVSASSASTSATTASNSSTAATLTVANYLPRDFAEDGKYWAETVEGAPTRNAIGSGGNYTTFATQVGEGRAAQVQGDGVSVKNIAPLGAIRYVSGRKYRVTVRGRSITTAQSVTIGVRRMDADYVSIGFDGLLTTALSTSATNISGDITADLPAGTVFIRPEARLNSTESGAVRWWYIGLDDVTDALAAAASASAASTSATSAATSATSAGTSASAASTSANTATTKAGEASTSASQAATSATNASGSATSATSSATLAATHSSAVGLTPNAQFKQGIVGWNDQYQGNETRLAPPGFTYQASWQDGTDVVTSDTPNGRKDIGSLTLYPVEQGRTYKTTMRVRVLGATARFYTMLSFFDATQTFVTHRSVITDVTPASGWQTLTSEWTVAQADYAYVKAGAITNYLNDAAVTGVGIDALYVEDITSEKASAGSASAAATSASAASTSATNAATSASSATTSANTATTKASEASSSATSAATSATNAAGSASSASTSATTAANSSSAAFNSAMSVGPKDFAQGGSFHTLNNNVGSAAQDLPNNFRVISGEGNVWYTTDTILNDVRTKWTYATVEGRTYRVVGRARALTANASFAIRLWGYDASYNNVGGLKVTSGTLTPAEGWVTYSDSKTATAGDVTATPRVGARFDVTAGAGGQVEVSLVYIEDITESTNAAGSASAAATSASSASTSSTNAGNSATSASTSANAASVSAGNASTSASTASTSATNASNSASAAATSAAVAASVNTGALNKSATFSDNVNTTGAPTNWTVAVNVSGATRVTGPNGVGYSWKIPGVAGENNYVRQSLATTIGIRYLGWYVIEADVTLNSGALTAAGVLFRVLGTGNEDHYIKLAEDKDETGIVPGVGIVGKTYRVRKIIQVRHSTASGAAEIYAMGHYSVIGSTAAANDITFHRVAVRSATLSEIEQGKAGGIEASVKQMQAALASINGRSTAFWQVQANAGTASTFITAQAATSDPSFGAITLNRGTYAESGELIYEGFNIRRTGKVTSSDSWNVHGVTEETYTGAAYISFRSGAVSSADQMVMIGLTDEAIGNSYTSIDYAIYMNGASNAVHCYESGTNALAVAGFTANEFFEIIYTAAASGTITYRRNGAVLRTVTGVGTGRIFRLQANLFDQLSVVKHVVFGSAAPSSASTLAIGATEFHVYNPSGSNWKKAMSVIDGNVILTGGLTAGAFIRQGNGEGWPVALAAADFQVKDGDAVDFGTTLASLPQVDFSTIGLDPLAAGESYNLYAESLSTTGFTARLKISTPGTPSNHNLTTSTAPGTGPTRQIDKSALADSQTGDYTITCGGQVEINNYSTSEPGNGEITIGIWVKRGGVWTEATTRTIFMFGNFGEMTSNKAWAITNESFNLGYQSASILQAVGVSVKSTIGDMSNPSLTSFTKLAWTSPGTASGERSATPDNQTIKCTVRPE